MNRSLNGKHNQSREVAVACHVHSDWSYDGKWTLDALAQSFSERGYQVIMMTEHDRGFSESRWLAYQAACAAASSEKILLVPGIEHSDPDNVVHILVWNAPLFFGESLPTKELLERVARTDAIAVMAHPTRREAWKYFEESWVSSLYGIELWNRKTDGWAPSRTADKLLGRGELVPFVGLDFHAHNQFFPLAMKLTLSSSLSQDAVFDAFRSGNFAATAFGRPLEPFVSGVTGSTLGTAEFFRRRAAPLYRYLRGAEVRK